MKLENKHTGEVLEIRREIREGETVFWLQGTLPAHRQGPPLHIHHFEDEEGVIAAGTAGRGILGRGQRSRLQKIRGYQMEIRTSSLLVLT